MGINALHPTRSSLRRIPFHYQALAPNSILLKKAYRLRANAKCEHNGASKTSLAAMAVTVIIKFDILYSPEKQVYGSSLHPQSNAQQ